MYKEQLLFTVWSGVVYWPALAVGSTAQLATSHYPYGQTMDMQAAAIQIQLCPSQLDCGLHPAVFSGNDSLFVVAIRWQFCHGWINTILQDFISLNLTPVDVEDRDDWRRRTRVADPPPEWFTAWRSV